VYSEVCQLLPVTSYAQWRQTPGLGHFKHHDHGEPTFSETSVLSPDYTVLKPIFIIIGVRINDLTYIKLIQQLRATLLGKLN
jgi:hypothetical protein